MGSRDIVQIVFLESFRKLDVFQREAVKVLLRCVVGQVWLEDSGSEKEGLLQFTREQLFCRPVRGFAIGMVIDGYISTEGTPIGRSCPTSQRKPGGELEALP